MVYEMNEIKVVHVITDLNTGGAEMMLQKLLERKSASVSAHVISLRDRGEIGPAIESLGIPVDALDMNPGKIPSPKIFLGLVRRLRQLKPDIVHTWMYHANLIGGFAAKMAGVPAVTWAIHHSNLSPSVNKKATLAVVRACGLISQWLPHRIICCSESALRVHVGVGYAQRKMRVIPNGFDLSRFKPDPEARVHLRDELDLEIDTPLVGLIGRFDPQKNHEGFFVAAGMVSKKNPSVHFLLAGLGIDENNEKLMRSVCSNGVEGVTHLLGLRNDIPRVMASLDVLVSSSIGEAFPNVLGEAMACEVPCVVTDAGDCASIIGDTGLVVENGDMAGLAGAIEQLLSLSQEDRTDMGGRARERVDENFELNHVVDRYETFYHELIEQEQA
jgi:glycosyltransferase involved in cell wall biosynthesis